MSTSTCERALEALEHGPTPGLDGTLAEHARSCASCAEAFGVVTSLRRAASATAPRFGLASASHLWWRAQIIRDLVVGESIVERATRSTRWVQGICFGLLCLLITLGLTQLSANLFSYLEIQAAAGSGTSWDWLAGLLLAGTIVPLAGFTLLWVVWREA